MKRLWISFLLLGMGGGSSLLNAGETNATPASGRVGANYEVPYYTGVIYPTPQEAKYEDVFLPLSRVGVILGDKIAKTDARLQEFTERLERLGGKCEIVAAPEGSFDAFLMFGEGPAAQAVCKDEPPAKPEGYLLAMFNNGRAPVIALKGRDQLGLLWGVTALNQLMFQKDGRVSARKAEVRDYPDVAGIRGCSMPGDPQAKYAWFAVNCLRANVVTYGQLFRVEWRKPDKWFAGWQASIKAIGDYLNPLGIEWYDVVVPTSGKAVTNIRSKSEEDYQAVLKIALALAEAGGNLSIMYGYNINRTTPFDMLDPDGNLSVPYDDARFPLSPEDKKDFGGAREADIYFINKLHAAVRAKYPKFQILLALPFCSEPFADSSQTTGESPDEYLKAMGERLPEDVAIYWTGPRNKSNRETPEGLAWITGLIRRPPVLLQSKAGISHGGIYWCYPGDVFTAWKDGLYDGLTFYAHNAQNFHMNMTQFDYLWNRKAYDPAASSAEALKKLVGLTAYPQVTNVCAALEDMDIYGWGPSILGAKNLEDVRRRTGEVLARYDEALEANAVGVKLWTSLPLYVEYRKTCLDRLLKKQDLLKELAQVEGQVRATAIKETAADLNADVVLTANDFRGQRPPRFYAREKAENRYVTWINGAKTKMANMEASFALQKPPSGDFELVISGLDHNAQPPCRIRILANNNTVFEGPNPFAGDKWTTHSFTVKGSFLRDNLNTLTVMNLEDSDIIAGPPWFMLNYAVIRPVKAQSK